MFSFTCLNHIQLVTCLIEHWRNAVVLSDVAVKTTFETGRFYCRCPPAVMQDLQCSLSEASTLDHSRILLSGSVLGFTGWWRGVCPTAAADCMRGTDDFLNASCSALLKRGTMQFAWETSHRVSPVLLIQSMAVANSFFF